MYRETGLVNSTIPSGQDDATLLGLVDRGDEVFALVRALAINDRHQRITGESRRRENPMGDILLARLESASAEVA